jgi:hypothetical protein
MLGKFSLVSGKFVLYRTNERYDWQAIGDSGIRARVCGRPWLSDELLHRLIHQAAKGGVDMANDVPGTLDRQHRRRRAPGDGEEAARQTARLQAARQAAQISGCAP